ncbi:exopolygalacturonase-like [Benincasa hispida]|uniref:exopolygalacturonase-like n=1 Tax=Benincasa hispida TaxID=102211 RepID=UPI0018FFD790|nr:exopolygalacturonase-like [Benincasa hispida]
MAWNAACANNGGGLVLVPAIGRFLVLPLLLQGPCNGFIQLQIDGDLLASPDKAFVSGYYWLQIHQVNNLAIHGLGRLVGRGQTAWPYNTCSTDASCTRLPINLIFQSVNIARIRNIKSFHSKSFHFALNGCNDVLFDNVTVIAPSDSPNTDGIHISMSTGITIQNSLIATGDDCISLGPGSHTVNITNVHCGPGHGISIGSLGRYPNESDVSGITVRDTKFYGTMNGVRIKTWSSSYQSVLSNVAFLNLEMHNVNNPIVIDQNYCPHNACQQTKVSESRVQIKDVKYEDIRGSSSIQAAVTFNCSQVAPCQGIVLQNINLTFNGTGSSTSICQNVRGSSFGPQLPPCCF